MLSGVSSMPPEIKNGLLDMESRPRRVPPPRHPKLLVETPPAPIEAPGCAIVAGGCASRRQHHLSRCGPPKQPALRGAQVYLDSPADEFLRACRAAGEVSNSAVIRLALQELAAVMTPTDVARTLLLSENSARRRPGRKKVS